MGRRRNLTIFALAFLAAFAGTFVHRTWFGPTAPRESELHHLLHSQLDLDAAQEARLATIEREFALRREAFARQLSASNRRLAQAIATEQANGPAVAAAVDQSHTVMGDLQKETLAHIFAMRQVLRPDQAAKFDRVIVRALTAEQR
ncbi:heavy metal resistance protein [Sphingomonas koreensis]|jgi:nickel and cobalt resistance protein CnrR|uniref:Heavy metal resistance protein n=1 Tax=Sphingomonas koreensis TaxID=93064 RepID=A0A1L6JBE4_9SPHN|nr:periplasmic heavy metal sensor [Sphingomonas koreensis]APR53157.1 heavy metal resistance protein [Sphingomonas koreensis]RSU24716.1 heavy metal resistance protein [Sphingomonas koreensis]RSU24978.1 heavy metal resistance protein [Sphingomonas koreensis]RSU27014.1 heavy metal resistance protein [Sphingomonas koreensis]RSU32849.1 heavy metal resistance protein [Sphingomonas koreensis]